jgi:serine/threonine protein kinase
VQIDTRHLVVGRWLGEGSFGVVFEARYAGQDAAIKVFKGGQAASSRLSAEALCLASLRHAFVVEFLGVCSDPEARDAIGAPVGLALVMQHARHGSVLKVMRDLEKRKMLCGRGEWLQFLSQAASGIGYLHSRSLLHRDVKAGNVLVTAQARPLVADFGLACAAGSGAACGQGTWSYKAPELFKDGVASVHSDSYAFGGVMWFVGSAAEDPQHQSEPWEGKQGLDVMDFVMAGRRPGWQDSILIPRSLERFRQVLLVCPSLAEMPFD